MEGMGRQRNVTVRSKEGVTVSGKAPKAWVDDGGDWREKKGCG